MGAREHNLKDIDVEIPLGLFTVVTGVSGSGKSTLVNDILYRALAREIYGCGTHAGAHEDRRRRAHRQSDPDRPVADRAHAALESGDYTGLFTPIRDLYAMLPESRERGYKPGRFSFNVKGGRCEACQGDGLKRIEMNFLPDVYVTCDVCRGQALQSRNAASEVQRLLDCRPAGADGRRSAALLENIPQIR